MRVSEQGFEIYSGGYKQLRDHWRYDKTDRAIMRHEGPRYTIDNTTPPGAVLTGPEIDSQQQRELEDEG